MMDISPSENALALSDVGFETDNGPFTDSEREFLQRSIENWIQKNAKIPCGFDIGICAWKGDQGTRILAGVCAMGPEVTDPFELKAKKEALEAILFAHSISVPGDPDIYCLRMNDDYRSQPLLLDLESSDGRFFVSLATWFNYVSVGKELRFLEFVGNLLCQMRIYDQKLLESFERAFGMVRIAPQGQGDTPLFSPELPDLRQCLPRPI